MTHKSKLKFTKQPRKIINSDPIKELLSGAAFALGVATANKQKKNKKKSKATKQPQLVASSSVNRLIQLPAAYGNQSRSSHSHTPFVVRGNTICMALVTNGTGQPVLRTIDGNDTATNVVCIDLAGAGSAAYDYQFFQPRITNMSRSFMMYRIKRLSLRYVPTVSTTASQQLLFATSPEVVTKNIIVPAAEVATATGSVTTSAWSTVTLNAMPNGIGLRKDWCFIDSIVTASEANLRQETTGTFMWSYLGNSIFNAVFGYMVADFEVEMQGFGPQNFLEAPRPNIPSVEEPQSSAQEQDSSKGEQETGEYISVPRSLLNSVQKRL